MDPQEEKELIEVKEFLTKPDEAYAEAWNSVTDEQAKRWKPWRQMVWSPDYKDRYEQCEKRVSK